MLRNVQWKCLLTLGFFGSLLAVHAEEKAVSDEKFVQKAAHCNLMEIEMGKLATKNATNERVRAFATQMIADHGKASAEFAAIVKKLGYSPVHDKSQEHQEMWDKLSKLSGADFDRMYIKSQVKAHQEAITLFTNQAKNGQKAELRDFASKTLPTLKEHLKKAEEIAKSVDKVQ